MNRSRLERVRDTVRTLKAIADDQHSLQTSLTRADTLTSTPKALPRIDMLDMRVLHARHEDCTAGCITGITIGLYPDEAVRIADDQQRKHGHRPPPRRIAEGILDIEGPFTHALLSPQPHINRYCITPEQAATAIDRLLAGENPDRIWDHTD